MSPAAPPIPKVEIAPRSLPGAVYDCAIVFKNPYEPNRVALFAAWRAVVGTNPWKKPRISRSRKMMGTAWRKPRMRGLADLRSSMLRSVRATVKITDIEDNVHHCLNALERGDGECRLKDTSSKSCDDCSGTRELAIRVLQ